MLPLDPPALVVLPDPISTNNLFANLPGRGRVMTKAYRDWKQLAARMLMAQRPLPTFALPVEITIYAGEKNTGPMDADNAVKACLDALVVAKVIHDDSRKWVRRCGAVWVPGMAGTVVKITVAQPDINPITVMQAVKPGLRGFLV